MKNQPRNGLAEWEQCQQSQRQIANPMFDFFYHVQILRKPAEKVAYSPI
jgi:hypothetical protein